MGVGLRGKRNGRGKYEKEKDKVGRRPSTQNGFWPQTTSTTQMNTKLRLTLARTTKTYRTYSDPCPRVPFRNSMSR